MLNIIRISKFHSNMERLLQLAFLSSSCCEFRDARKIGISCGIMSIDWVDLVLLSLVYHHSKLLIHHEKH